MYALGACQCAGCRKAMDREFWNLILDNGLELEAMTVDGEAYEVTPAYELGKERGLAAATWLLDGNSTRRQATVLLVGLLDGDPMVIDTLPSNPLSGEWAGDPTPMDIIAEVAPDLEDPEYQQAIIEDYENGFNDGVQEGAEKEARQFLGVPDGVDAVMYLQWNGDLAS